MVGFTLTLNPSPIKGEGHILHLWLEKSSVFPSHAKAGGSWLTSPIGNGHLCHPPLDILVFPCKITEH
jgi:hypothetical protein